MSSISKDAVSKFLVICDITPDNLSLIELVKSGLCDPLARCQYLV